MSGNFKKINLRTSNDQPLQISPAEVPTLSPQDKIAHWMKDDPDPYYKIQQIEYPLMANGFRYIEDFFKSFLAKVNKGPIPGSKDGHDMRYGVRASTDLLLVGGAIKSNGDGTGSVLLKNYIPPVAESDNANFIKEAKAGMIDFSLVAYTRDQKVENEDGSSTWEVVESLFGERNDAVGYGEGAMNQKTNASDEEEFSGDKSVAGKNKNRGEDMDKKELMNTLATFKANGDVSLPEIAKHLGLESLLITDAQKANLGKLSKVNTLLGDGVDPVEWIETAKAEKKANAESVREARMVEEFGPKEIKESGKKNLAREAAELIVAGRELSDEVIAEVKANAIYQQHQMDVADPTSDMNEIGGVAGKTNKSAIGGAVEV